jgi:hypothetical protein
MISYLLFANLKHASSLPIPTPVMNGWVLGRAVLHHSLFLMKNMNAHKIPFQLCFLIAVLCKLDLKIQVWICVDWNVRHEGALDISSCLLLVR